MDQQPLKTAQFYVISRKCEALVAIKLTAQTCTPVLSARLKSVGFYYRNSDNSVALQVIYASCCFITHLKYYPSCHSDAELPTVVEFPYIPEKNTGPALEAPLQVITIY